MQILTYPVGVVIGILPIVVELGVPPKPASLRLDGRTVCALTAESPGCSVDLGASPRLHFLELVRADGSGRVVESVTRWINRPGADQAEVQTRTACPPSAGTCTVKIGWAHPERLAPTRIRTALDGKPVRLPEDRTLVVPARSVRGTLLTVELAFPDGARATFAGAVGGRAHGDESAAIVPMLHEGACAESRSREIARGYAAARLPVRAIEPGEPGDWQVTFVVETSVLKVFRGWFEEKKARLIGEKRLRVPDSLAEAFGPSGNVLSWTAVLADGPLREFDLLQGGNPVFWVERLVAALRGEGAARPRTADAVAAAGFHAGAAPRKRAVVLLLGAAARDESHFLPSGAVAYLAETRVPFEAWNLGGAARADWIGSRRLSTSADLRDALISVRRRVACQAVAWVEADFPAASKAANAIGFGLAPLPAVPPPELSEPTPSDDVTRRTLELVRTPRAP